MARGGVNKLSSLLRTQMFLLARHKRVYTAYARKHSFVYFGHVDQHQDEQSIVRGITVSPRHKDRHYCIGVYDDYDVALVERSNTLFTPTKPPRDHSWIILSIDLHLAVDLPVVFIGLDHHGDTFYELLFTRYPHLSHVQLIDAKKYNWRFLKRFKIYTKPEQAVSVERLFSPVVVDRFIEHFGSFSVEISDGTIYLYSEHQHPTAATLEKMLTSGVWLAKTLDGVAIT